MYPNYFGLREPSFSITPDPHYLFLSEQHREALAHLLYGASDNGGFVLLSGEVGTGKTTVCRAFLEQLPAGVEVALVLNPALTAIELMHAICDEFGVAVPAAETSAKALLDRLNAFLLEAHADGRHPVLIIDEAQNLRPKVLEQVRLLTNLETTKHKLLQIFLIGQPELKAMLASPELRQLNQRITARFHLRPLDARATAAYVEHRISVAGVDRPLFTPAALRAVHRHAGGVPRLINLICDRALLGAAVSRRIQVTPDIVRRAAREVRGERRSGPRVLRPLAQAAALLLVALLGVGAGAWLGTSGQLAALGPQLASLMPGAATAPRPPAAVADPATGDAPAAGDPDAMPSPVTDRDAVAAADAVAGDVTDTGADPVSDGGLATASPGDAQVGPALTLTPIPTSAPTPGPTQAGTQAGTITDASASPASADSAAPPDSTTPPVQPMVAVSTAVLGDRGDDRGTNEPVNDARDAGLVDAPPAVPATDRLVAAASATAAAAPAVEPPAPRIALARVAPVVAEIDEADLASLTIPTTAAVSALLQHWGLAADVAIGCGALAESHGLACERATGRWSDLRRFDRPAALRVRLDGREREVVISALDDEFALVEQGGVAQRVPIAVLDERWSGEFLMLWRPPVPGVRNIGSGTTGEAVHWLRARLAALPDAGIAAEGPDRFDAGLAGAVRRFQQDHGLIVDGIAGPRTIILLDNALTAADVPRLSQSR